MKSTGIIRQVDELGRFVIPISLRRSLNIACNDCVEMCVEGSSIVLRRHERSCVICGNGGSMVICKGKPICSDCCSGLEALARTTGEDDRKPD